MNILFCQPTLDFTGSEISLLGIVRMLRTTGPERLFLLAGKDGPIAKPFEQTTDGMTIVDAPKLRRRLGVLPRFLWSFATVYSAIRKLKKTHDISVVYVNTVMFPQAVVGAFLNRLRCIVHIHEIETTYPWFVYQTYLALTTMTAGRVICVCRYILDQRRIFFRGALKKKARVVYNASSFDAGPIARSIEGTLRILLVGATNRKKGMADILPIVKALRDTIGNRPFELKIVGRVQDEGLYNRVVTELRETGLKDRVTFCGESDDLEAFYREAHLLLHPTHTDVFPMVLVEAASMSLPAVTTHVGGCAEAVIHGTTGFVVPVGDHAAMATHVCRLTDDPTLYQTVCAAAYDRYRSKYTPEATVTDIRDVISEVARH